MRIGLYLPLSAEPAGSGELEAVLEAEELGFDAVWARDMLLPGSARYPQVPDGDQQHECMSYLCFLAARTHRIRLGTAAVTVAARHPLLLAKQAATLDVLSGGRFVLGVGTGFRPELYDCLGLAHANRHELLIRGLRDLRALWGGAEPTVVPAPLTPDGPPVYLASGSVPEGPAAGLVDGWMRNRRAASQDRADIARFRSGSGSGASAVVIDFSVALCHCSQRHSPAEQVIAPFRGQVLTVRRPAELIAALRVYEKIGTSDILLSCVGHLAPMDQLRMIGREVLPAFRDRNAVGSAVVSPDTASAISRWLACTSATVHNASGAITGAISP